MKRFVILALCALFSLCGCAGVPFPATELVPVTPRNAKELVAGLWSSGSGTVMVSHSALFEMGGMKVPVSALMRLDRDRGEARLVGMNEMGVKLYDVEVTRKESRAHFLVPDLERYPGFAEAVGASVRRIFLEPFPTGEDTLEIAPRQYLFTRSLPEGSLRFALGGTEAQLIEKSYRGKDGAWQVGYYRYGRGEAGLFPGGIVLRDDRAGYRLTLWIEGVEKDDE